MVHVARGAVVRPKSERIARSAPSNFANRTITRAGSIALTEIAKRPRTCRRNLKFGTTTRGAEAKASAAAAEKNG